MQVMQIPAASQAIQTNASADAHYKNEVARITLLVSDNNLFSHLKGAFAGITSLSATGVGVTAASVALAKFSIVGSMLVLGIFSIIGVAIVAVTAAILWWIIIANSSDNFRTEKEAELRNLHANMNVNIAKNPNHYDKYVIMES